MFFRDLDLDRDFLADFADFMDWLSSSLYFDLWILHAYC